jgi:hypothetical protein
MVTEDYFCGLLVSAVSAPFVTGTSPLLSAPGSAAEFFCEKTETSLCQFFELSLLQSRVCRGEPAHFSNRNRFSPFLLTFRPATDLLLMGWRP